jgi:hypothetical protein
MCDSIVLLQREAVQDFSVYYESNSLHGLLFNLLYHPVRLMFSLIHRQGNCSIERVVNLTKINETVSEDFHFCKDQAKVLALDFLLSKTKNLGT